jgi:putative SOS response-associated peptidase YedK
MVAFSDAVVAIAITRVVLPLVDLAHDGTHETVAQFLRDNALALAAVALSFVVIGNLWQAHHEVFESINGFTRVMMQINFIWLAALVFLPLPTVLIVSETNSDQLGTVLYIGTIVAGRPGTLDRRLQIAKWGLVPSWAKDTKIGSKLINARSESILEKPSFRSAAVKRRAIVPAEGYYEWQKTEDGKKIPNYLFSEKEPLLGFAGLYEFWPDPALPEADPERWLLTCTVQTPVTQDALGHVHDRPPVIIPKHLFVEWLRPGPNR